MISTSSSNGLNQIITMVITASILLITLCFIIWTSYIEKKENKQFYKNKIAETENIILGLIDVKKMKMKALIETMANGPILKSAIATQHDKTINDVLTVIKNKNSLSFVALIKDKKIMFSDNNIEQSNSSIKSLSKANFLGVTKVGEMNFVIASKLKPNELSQWSKITGAKFIITDNNDNTIIRNFEYNEFSDNRGEIQFTKDNSSIIGITKALKNTLFINFYLPTNEIRKSFERKRNKYLFLGGVLTFLGFVISLIVSNIISRMLDKTNSNGNITLDELYKEIEDLKEKVS